MRQVHSEALLFIAEKKVSPNIRRGILGVGILALSLTACLPIARNLVPKMTNEVGALDVAPPGTSTTTSSVDISSPATTESTTSTTLPPTEAPTTTVLTPEPVVDSHAYQPNNCDQGNTLRVFTAGEDGQPAKVQVSIDVVNQEGVKIHHPEGTPVENPLYTYSNWVVTDGQTSYVCFENIPDNSRIFTETYDKSDESVANPTQPARYGSTMYHNLWVGEGQDLEIYQVLPLDQSAGGSAGAIQVNTTVNGQPTTPTRNVGWSSRALHPGRPSGFGVRDRAQTGAPEERLLSGLVGDEEYLFQSEFVTEDGVPHVVIMRDIPVHPKDKTTVEIRIDELGCHGDIQTNAETIVAKTCSVDTEPIG